MARGHTAVPPFSTRILKPLVASSMAALTGLSPEQAFRALTPLEILASLLALLAVLRRRRVSWQGQAALLLAFGSALAVDFGHAPILVCSFLLLLASLMVLALDRGQLALGLAVACLAALTKEYGVILGFAWGVHAYSRGRRLGAFGGALVPLLTLGIATHLSPAAVSSGSRGWWELFKGSAFYELQLLGSRYGSKIAYLWLWSVLWPVLLLAAVSLVGGLRKRTMPDTAGLAFGMMLVASPVLLSGDWDRSLLILVPFACIAVSFHPLIEEPKFQALLAIGGITTALARPLYTVLHVPRYFTLGMIAVSIVATAGITAQMARHQLRAARGPGTVKAGNSLWTSTGQPIH